MASVSSSPSYSSQAAVLLLLHQPPHQHGHGGACLRYRGSQSQRRENAVATPLGLSAAGRGGAGGLLLLPPLPALRAAEGKDGRAVTKDEEEAAAAAVEEEGEGEVEVRREEDKPGDDGSREAAARGSGSGRFSADYISLGIREPVYEVREQAILVNLGSLRAIAMHERVLIFNYNSPGGKAFLDSLLPRLNPRNINGGPAMPFQLEVVEAALLSRIQRLERRLMRIEPRSCMDQEHASVQIDSIYNGKKIIIWVSGLISQVELGSRAGDLKQMLIDLLDDPHEIRRICIMGRNCTLDKLSDNMECSVPLEKQIAEEEEEEIEMLLENYLQRCESIHGQAERLLDSAREMEDSIAVNLSSRRLEVSRVELLLQVGTFCVAIGALIAGIFGMNLKSYLETNAWAFWATTGGIVVGAVAGFFIMYSYLKTRKIL
uniref:Magnesium transporter n=1 Tax=Oryza meridionalis TaxID=40149 RepID=A0A0E0D4N1_9ORYZ